MPLLVLYGIAVLLTPIAVIFLLVRSSKLGEQLSNLKANSDSQIFLLQKQVTELNRRLQSLQSSVTERSATPESGQRTETIARGIQRAQRRVRKIRTAIPGRV